MTTDELENKLKISKNTCIHCPTLKLAEQVLNIFHKIGLKWCSGIYYPKCTNWDDYKENTVYYPFKGAFSSLEFAQEEGYKIINAKKFIASHVEEFKLETYEPKGELEGFPKEIIARMLDCQEEQGNPRDVSVFEKYKCSLLQTGGFNWYKTKEKEGFWHNVISNKDFDLFFIKYRKQDNSQEFRVGDKVYDILLGEIGIVKNIILNNVSAFPIEVYYESCGIVFYALEGKYLSRDKYPRLLHYRDDYDYSVIDFNNLPKRQYKRWRAEKEEYYYFIRRDDYNSELDRVCETKDYYSYISNEQYKIGNYFQTKEEAQEVADKLKKYFKQIIQEEHE